MQNRPDAMPSNIFVAISSAALMGLGSIEIAEKKALQGGAPAYLYNFGYKSDDKIKNIDYPLGPPPCNGHCIHVQHCQGRRNEGYVWFVGTRARELFGYIAQQIK